MARRNPSAPLPANSVAYPAAASARPTNERILGSSSTIRMRPCCDTVTSHALSALIGGSGAISPEGQSVHSIDMLQHCHTNDCTLNINAVLRRNHGRGSLSTLRGAFLSSIFETAFSAGEADHGADARRRRIRCGRLEAHVAPAGAGGRADDGQAEAGSACLRAFTVARGVQPGEAIEGTFCLRGGNPGSVVGDGEHAPLALR